MCSPPQTRASASLSPPRSPPPCRHSLMAAWPTSCVRPGFLCRPHRVLQEDEDEDDVPEKTKKKEGGGFLKKLERGEPPKKGLRAASSSSSSSFNGLVVDERAVCPARQWLCAVAVNFGCAPGCGCGLLLGSMGCGIGRGLYAVAWLVSDTGLWLWAMDVAVIGGGARLLCYWWSLVSVRCGCLSCWCL